MTDVTRILSAIQPGDTQAAERLLPLVYDELRKLAAHRMTQEASGQTLQATALVHEAYVRHVDGRERQRWDSRGHFFAAAAEAMRRILVDRAREQGAKKRGGDRRRVPLAPDLLTESNGEAVLDLHEALAVHESHDAQAAKLVKMRYFAGIPHTQAAELMGIGRREADRLWTIGRTWLYREMSEHE